jgi:hypothetical protein
MSALPEAGRLAKLISTAPWSMAMSSPGMFPAGTEESAASFTVVEAQTRRVPRRGSVTLVVAEPEVTEPLETMMARPAVTSSAPVTVGA